MSIPEFISELQSSWDRKYTQHQAQRVSEKLLAFTGDERERIFHWLEDHCRYLPATKDLHDVAKDLGIFQLAKFERGGMASPFFTDRINRCERCGGTGLRYVYNEIGRDTEGRVTRRFHCVRPAVRLEDSKGFCVEGTGPITGFQNQGLEEVLYRCDCESGERQPKCLKRLRSEAENRELREQHQGKEIPF